MRDVYSDPTWADLEREFERARRHYGECHCPGACMVDGIRHPQLCVARGPYPQTVREYAAEALTMAEKVVGNKTRAASIRKLLGERAVNHRSGL